MFDRLVKKKWKGTYFSRPFSFWGTEIDRFFFVRCAVDSCKRGPRHARAQNKHVGASGSHEETGQFYSAKRIKKKSIDGTRFLHPPPPPPSAEILFRFFDHFCLKIARSGLYYEIQLQEGSTDFLSLMRNELCRIPGIVIKFTWII